ncbi:MAG: hypothetical protein BMS9Abin26_1941 [Gammaproteobacteria bacterium]|nr:MAG: hypothetical protein BMS9Abin26_1941 [Gammaproteobacteria bacterium]
MTLRSRIMLFAGLTIMLVAITLIVAGIMTQGEIEDRFEAAKIEGDALLWQMIVNNQMDIMESNSTALARDRETRNALKARDTDSMRENIKTTYNLLSTGGILTGVMLTDNDGTVLVSVPDTGHQGKSSMLARQALKEGKVKRGQVPGIDGRLVMAVSFPMYSRGRTIGAAIYVNDFENAVSEMKKSSNSEVAILDENQRISYASDQSFYDSLKLQIPDMGVSVMQTAKLDKRVYSAAIQPIEDTSGEPKAYLVNIKDYTQSYNRQSKLIWSSLLLTAVIILLLLGALFFYMNRAFLKLHAVISVVRAIATGDLTVKSEENVSRDETGQLTAAMGAMIDNLGIMVVEINNTTEKLGGASDILTMISDKTSKGIQQQLSETEQVATAINELNSTALEVARNASDAADAARQANSEAKQGEQISEQLLTVISNQSDEVRSAASSLSELQQKTEQINTIIGVINGIAEQTNLLALNAAIEAARAGEQGRGFAVVADEVRTLATRTSESTSEIDTVIRQFKEGVNSAVSTMSVAMEEAGKTVKFVGETTSRLTGIAESVNTIDNMVTQIATATEEQTAVIEEINRNVVSIKTIAEDVTESSEQNASTTGEISQLAITLGQLVNKFKI